MATDNREMSDHELPPDDWEFSEAERRVLELLAEGRETRGSIADQLDVSPEWAGEQLRTLRALGIVEYHHKGTGLYQLSVDPDAVLEESRAAE